MAEYIERESLLKQANELAGGVFGTPRIIVAIKNAPKADVVEVKHGRWIERRFEDEMIGMYISAYRCSECHTTWETDSNYCPYCGAKMDLKEGAEG